MPNGDDYWAHKYPLPCETKTPEEEPEADEPSEEELSELEDDLVEDDDEDGTSTD
jgi:hypothetical protein